MMNAYRVPGPHHDERLFFGDPFLGGVVGGLLGGGIASAFLRPRPFYPPFPPRPFYPYGPYPYGGFGGYPGPYGFY